MDVDLTVESGDYRLVNPHINLNLDSANTLLLRDYGKKKLVIGIRPENILLVDEEDAILSAQCLVAEPQGSHQVVAVEIDDKLVKIVAPAHPKVNSGETVHLAFK